MATNDFLPFATGGGANVESQATYLADSTTTAGFTTGVASAQKCNKVWRQASFVAAGVAQFVVNTLSINVNDDGNLTNFVTNLTNAIKSLVGAAAVPTGAVQMYAMATMPSGWLTCNGQAVSRTTYAALFAAVATTYGAGNGTTTFNVPDLRGQFVRGLDQSAGVDPSRALGTTQASALGPHNHLNGVATVTATGVQVYGDTYDGMPGSATTALRQDGSASTQGFTSTTPAAETRPTNVALVFGIKI